MFTQRQTLSLESVPNPILVVCNLSFEQDDVSLKILETILSKTEGLEIVAVDDVSEAYLHRPEIGWGVLPIFSKQLPREEIEEYFNLTKKKGYSVVTLYYEYDARPEPYIRLGSVMSAERVRQFENGTELLKYAESKLLFFKEAKATSDMIRPSTKSDKSNINDWNLIKGELDWLESKGRLLMQRDRFKLYLTTFSDLEIIPQEIGRLRAVTYEEVGEGTGSTIDLDVFDQVYQQLFLVDVKGKQIVGGYRIGPGIDIANQYGIEGFYIYTLYEIENSMSNMLSASIELGRSFVCKAYQKQRLPLFLLWNGILAFLHTHPSYRYIIGTVSISRAYSDISRNLITTYLKRHHFDAVLASSFRPRQAYYESSSQDSLNTIIQVLNGKLIHLDEFISEIEPKNYRLPVLIKKYINQNARFIGFNLDPSFSNCVDGLMVLDIRDLPLRTIQMYT